MRFSAIFPPDCIYDECCCFLFLLLLVVCCVAVFLLNAATTAITIPKPFFVFDVLLHNCFLFILSCFLYICTFIPTQHKPPPSAHLCGDSKRLKGGTMNEMLSEMPEKKQQKPKQMIDSLKQDVGVLFFNSAFQVGWHVC